MRWDHHETLKHLAKANEHVALGEQHLARLRRVITDLERNRRQTSGVRALLERFTQLQATHIAHRDLLVQKLEGGSEGVAQSEQSSGRVQDCLTEARRCGQLASLADDPSVQLTLADIAEQWKWMASEINQLEQEQSALASGAGSRKAP